MKKIFCLLAAMLMTMSSAFAQNSCDGKGKDCKGNKNECCGKACCQSKKMLLLVDVQYDFINGSLAVTGATETMCKLAAYINAQPVGTFKQIAMTADFHPYNHSSFKDNGGLWPVHCVQFSHGASIFDPVMSAVKKHQVDAPVLTKGDDIAVDEYSIMANKPSAERLLQIIKDNDIQEIYVAGLCGDFCVGNTIKDLVAAGYGKNIRVLKSFIGNIDDGTVLNGIIKDNNLEVR